MNAHFAALRATERGPGDGRNAANEATARVGYAFRDLAEARGDHRSRVVAWNRTFRPTGLVGDLEQAVEAALGGMP